MLGDGHSYFKPVNEPYDEGESPPVLYDESTPEDIGYIRVRYTYAFGLLTNTW